MKLSKFRSTFFIATLLLGGIAFTLAGQSVSAQGVSPTATPTVNIVPTLQSVIATQQIQLDEQGRTIKNTTDDLSRAEKDWQWKWGIAGAIVGALGTILASLGISNLTDFKKKLNAFEKEFSNQLKQLENKWEKHTAALEQTWEKRSAESLNQTLEKFDLRNLPIFIPKGNGSLLRRLELSGLQHEEYESLKSLKSTQGVIVVNLESGDDQKAFREFVEKSGLNPQKTAFVLYAEPSTVQKETIKCFENLVIANFPATVVSNILAIGRGLQIEA